MSTELVHPLPATAGAAVHLSTRLAWAGVVLEPQQRRDVAQLGAFCGRVQQLAEGSPTLARTRLGEVMGALDALDASHSTAASMVRLIRRGRMPARAVRLLVQTLSDHAGPLALAGEAQLLTFAHGTGGAIGEALAHVLGARHPAARALANDLGVAMQLTRIARDVLADATRHRVFLPTSWMHGEVSCEALLSGEAHATRRAIAATQRVLALADRYYASAMPGYRFLALRPRAAVAIAARAQRAIGTQLLANHHRHWWLQREVINPARRLIAMGAGLVDACRSGAAPDADLAHEGCLLA